MRARWSAELVFGLQVFACGRSTLDTRRSEAGVSADVVSTQVGDSSTGSVDISPALTRDAATADLEAGERPGIDVASVVAPWELTCGNGFLDDPGEQCDDGNLEFGPGPYGEGCDPSCRIARIGCFASDAGG